MSFAFLFVLHADSTIQTLFLYSTRHSLIETICFLQTSNKDQRVEFTALDDMMLFLCFEDVFEQNIARDFFTVKIDVFSLMVFVRNIIQNRFYNMNLI